VLDTKQEEEVQVNRDGLANSFYLANKYETKLRRRAAINVPRTALSLLCHVHDNAARMNEPQQLFARFFFLTRRRHFFG
jgi:hypothetical protein